MTHAKETSWLSSIPSTDKPDDKSATATTQETPRHFLTQPARIMLGDKNPQSTPQMEDVWGGLCRTSPLFYGEVRFQRRDHFKLLWRHVGLHLCLSFPQRRMKELDDSKVKYQASSFCCRNWMEWGSCDCKVTGQVCPQEQLDRLLELGGGVSRLTLPVRIE